MKSIKARNTTNVLLRLTSKNSTTTECLYNSKCFAKIF